jgi:uncharacterized phage protein gp47/JayE
MTTGLAFQVTEAGVSAPAYADILAGLQSKVQAIYGSDIYLDPDSKDGQLIALFASAIDDCNTAGIGTYQQFSPSTAVGTGLASNVKLNGITKLVASNSTAPGTIVGEVGVTITGGVVRDENGNNWNLPSSVTIPPAGQIDVTVTAQVLGAIAAPSGTIDRIQTPTRGWQSFTSTADAVPGAAVESDALLRQRQTVSTSLPALTPLGATLGALSNLSGVQLVKVYENATDTVDVNGLPKRSISVVIRGGDLAAIAQVIGQKKTPGAGTYGTTGQPYTDPKTGIAYTINFFVLVNSTIAITVTGSALTGYTTAQAALIQKSLGQFINGNGIGDDVEFTGLWGAGYQNMSPNLLPYRINSVTIGVDGGAQGTADIVVPFNKIAFIDPSTITVTIT